jgi:hypothetical protein
LSNSVADRTHRRMPNLALQETLAYDRVRH